MRSSVMHNYSGPPMQNLSGVDKLDAAGIKSKRRTDRFGRETGGKLLARGALYLMLQNRIYRGEIVHKQASYPGEHQPIIDEALWDSPGIFALRGFGW